MKFDRQQWIYKPRMAQEAPTQLKSVYTGGGVAILCPPAPWNMAWPVLITGYGTRQGFGLTL